MGILYVVGTPIGNLGDITKRALDTLNSVDLIACEDTRTSSNLLKYFNIDKPLVSYHKFNEKDKSDSLIKDLLNNKNIALITDAGMPSISDPGSLLVKKALKNKIEVYTVPGACALITALSSSGIITDSFTFYGFLNRESKKIKDDLQKIKGDSSRVAIIYESPLRLMKTLEYILEILDNPFLCICNDLTKKFEKKYYGFTKDVIEELKNNPNYKLGEYVIVIEKNKQVEVNDDKIISIEALLIDELVNNDCTMKEAIKLVSDKYQYSKNIVYSASLNIKRILKVGKKDVN